jgi:hypothetical protein
LIPEGLGYPAASSIDQLEVALTADKSPTPAHFDSGNGGAASAHEQVSD